jgi:rubrerythrin
MHADFPEDGGFKRDRSLRLVERRLFPTCPSAFVYKQIEYSRREDTVMAKYSVSALCNACGALHPMEIFVILQNGPVSKQSIGDTYQRKKLPPELSALKDKRVYCPNLGRQYSQKNDNHIFLIPVGSQQDQAASISSPAVFISSEAEKAEQLSNQDERMSVLLDKLGERLTFERQGTRLYEAFLEKIESAGGADEMAPSAEDLQRICHEEKEHFKMLQTAITDLGGDVAVDTPSADVAGVLSHGILQIVTDPRTNISQSLQAMLSAELMDNDGWQMLIELAGELGQSRLKYQCQKAREDEQQHIEIVRGWLSSMTLNEAAGEHALFETGGTHSADAEAEEAKKIKLAPIKRAEKAPAPRKVKILAKIK